jgi:hypothetical protein
MRESDTPALHIWPLEVIHFKGVGEESLGANISSEQLAEMCAWVASLGVDPAEVLPQFRILCWKGSFQLHLSRKVRRDGRDVFDQALGKVWSEPLVIDLGAERCWPKWLHDTQEHTRGC